MEFEDMREKIEWEGRRVATAFGVEEWEVNPPDKNRNRSGNWNFTGIGYEQLIVEWSIKSSDAQWLSIELRSQDVRVANQHWYPSCWVTRLSHSTSLETCFLHSHNKVMVCGLCRLDFEDESAFTQLPPLSAHEKMELRLSMPREFWPKKWLEEEGK